MKNHLTFSFSLLSLTLLMPACGGGGQPSQTPIQVNSTTVTVERGAVINAKVVDANGKVATSKIDSNQYIFKSTPTYPLTAIASNESWIDIDGDGNRTANDVVLDINMTSYSNVITPVTTILSDSNKTKRDALAQKLSQLFNIPVGDLSKAPSTAQNSGLAILTNAIYKAVKTRHAAIADIFNYKTLIVDGNNTLQKSDNTLSQAVENNSSLYTNGILDSSKIEKYLYDTNSSLFTKYTVPTELPYREVLSSDTVEKIWNIAFAIDNTKSYNNIKIGIEIVKHNSDQTPGSIGDFVYSDVNITNTSATVSRIDIYGKTQTKSGGIWYSDNKIPANAISINSGILSLNLGTMIKAQTEFSESVFKKQADYSITIVSDTPIFTTSSAKTLSLQTAQGTVNFNNKQGISGAIKIK